MKFLCMAWPAAQVNSFKVSGLHRWLRTVPTIVSAQALILHITQGMVYTKRMLGLKFTTLPILHYQFSKI